MDAVEELGAQNRSIPFPHLGGAAPLQLVRRGSFRRLDAVEESVPEPRRRDEELLTPLEREEARALLRLVRVDLHGFRRDERRKGDQPVARALRS